MNNVTSMAAPAVSAPSISSSAMLVEVSIGAWTGRKKDKNASEGVNRDAGAAANVATVNKMLLGKCDELKAVQNFVAMVRSSHYHMTMPWSDTGLRLLPTAAYFDYHKQITGYEVEFWRLVEQFLAAYTWEVSAANAKLGLLFNPNEYPTADALRGKFKMRVNYMPIPEAGDFRVDMGNEAIEVLKSHYDGFYGAQLERAMADIWERAYDALSKMAERLDYNDDSKKIFRDTLVTNVLDIVELLGTCNITGNGQMTAMQKNLEQVMRGVTAEGLREDAGLRKEVRDCVNDAIKSLPSLDM